METIVLTKYCNALQSEDKRKRKEALEYIYGELIARKAEPSYNDVIRSVFKCVLKSFNDRAEACREKAVTIIITIIQDVPTDDNYIGFLIPILVQRLGGQEIVEQSEEVRLLLLSLLHLVVPSFHSKLPPYLDDFIQILSKTLVDPYSKIRIESCECAGDLARAIPQYFHMQSETLIKPILQSFTHQQYRVRVASIISIGNVVQYGNNKSVCDVVGSLAERLFDQTPMVRQNVTNVVAMWLLHLRDRYSYFHRLLPLILTSLSDELPELREEAFKYWEEIGKQYMLENEQELKDRIDFLTEDPKHYPPNVVRPNLGCRILVQRNLCNIIPLLVKELDDWLPDVRVKSAQLLCLLVLNAEENITHHIEKVLVGMYRGCNDEDTRVADNVERAAEFASYFLTAGTLSRLVLPTMEDVCTAGHLRVLAAMLRGTERATLLQDLTQLANFLQEHDICHKREGNYQMQLLACCRAIMTVCKEDCTVVSQQLFNVIIAGLGLSAGNSVTSSAKELMEMLREVKGSESAAELYDQHIHPVLKDLRGSAASWTLQSPGRFIFEAILIHSGTVIGEHLDLIVEILIVAMAQDKDPEVRLKIFTVLAFILNGEEALKLCTSLQPFLISLVKDIIMPNLIWRAGRSAEAIRTVAIGSLYTVLSSQTCAVSSSTSTVIAITESLLPLLLSLIEDSAKKTRLYAMQTLTRLITLAKNEHLLKADHINQCYHVVLKRLDDVSDDVRRASVGTLTTLFSPLPADYDVVCCKAHLDTLYTTMLIHLDDPEPKFQQVVLGALKALAPIYPELLFERVESTKQNFRNVDGCTDLLKHMTYLKDS